MLKRRNLILFAGVLVAALILGWALSRRRPEGPKAENTVERMLSFAEADCVGWEVDWDGHRLRVERGEKAEDGWRLVVPAEGRADTASVVANVKNFNTLDIASVVAPTNSNLEPWGLARPSNRYTVFLREEGKIRPVTLWEGKPLDAGRGFYVRLSEHPSVLFVEDWVVLALRKRAGDVRLKQLIPFEPEAVTEISSGAIRFTKAKLRWSAPGAQDEAVLNPKVDEWVQTVCHLRAQYAFDAGEFDPAGRAPDHRLTLTGKTRSREKGSSPAASETSLLSLSLSFWIDGSSVVARRGDRGGYYRLPPEWRGILEPPPASFFREASEASAHGR